MIRQIDAATIDIFEIKSSTSEKGHLEDAAFQTVTIELSGISVNQISIIHVDKTYVRSGDIQPESLLVIADVTEKVREIIIELEPEIDAALDWVTQTQINEAGCECRYKGSIPNRCSAFDYLNPNIPELSIYNLPNIRTGRVRKFVETGRLDLMEVCEDEVTLPMLPVLKAAHSGEAEINLPGIKAFLDSLLYPLFFYDYETFKSAAPIMDGVSPHEQVPVQVSVHRLDADGTLTHAEYLAEGPGKRMNSPLHCVARLKIKGAVSLGINPLKSDVINDWVKPFRHSTVLLFYS